jgi:L-amino acid N-acyltransferase YncA
VRLRWGDEAASAQWPCDHPSATRFAVVLDGSVCGMVQYREEEEPAYRHARRSISFSIRLCTGRVSAATPLSSRYLVRKRGHHRLVIDPAADNEAAIRCYAAVGFRPVGIMRRYERDADGTGWHDALLMDLRAEDLDQPA